MHIVSRRRVWAAAVVPLLILAGCERARSGAPGDPLVLEPTDVHLVGTSESIATVEDLTLLSDGSVWLLNSVEPLFVGFGADGAALGEYGTRGGGPDEFGAPSGFLTGDSGPAAWVLDPRRHRFVRVPHSTTDSSEISLPRDSLPPGSVQGGMGFMSGQVRSARLGDEVILPRSFGSLRSGVYAFWMAVWGADLVAVDPLNGATRTVLSLFEKLGDPTNYLMQTNGFPPFPLWLRLWAVCSDSQIRVHDRLRNEVRGFTAAGTELEPIALPAPPFNEVSNDQFVRAIFGLRAAEVAGVVGTRLTPADSGRVFNELLQGMEGTPERLARFLPHYVDMRCADDGGVWLQPIDLELSNLQGGRTWLRVAPDAPVQEVQMPPKFDVFRFQGRRVWGVQRDELDVASVGWIELLSRF